MLTFLFLLGFPSVLAAGPVGTYNHGSIEEAVELHRLIRESGGKLVSVSPKEFQYGTEAMGQALLKIADWSKELSGKPLRVGDVSLRKGGKLALHLTHQTGLDADIGYLVRNVPAEGHRHKSFHNRFTEKLEGKDGSLSPNFDSDANARLFEKIADGLPVNSIFIGCTIYKALEPKLKASRPEVFARIFGVRGHEDHFHLKLKCPVGRAECSENWWVDPKRAHVPKEPRRRYLEGKWNECGWYAPEEQGK